jgi:hypothetical protein
LVEALRNLFNCSRTWRELLMSASYIAAVLYSLIIFGMAPLAVSDNATRAHTSVMTFIVVSTTYTYAAILLLS